ncbi:MAG: FmdB family zinc ribbon protein [Bryobacteraceae bacterium]
MPLYEYRCAKCGKTFEIIQKFADAPLTTHEGCGGEVERLLSAPAFQFKGSGWYVTDYAKSSSSSPKHEERTPAKTEPKTESTTASTESKPATTPKSD